MNKSIGILTTLIAALIIVSSSLAQEGSDSSTTLPGAIAYIGTDYNVYRIPADNSTPTMLTSDAGEMRQYSWPTWSTDGRLAYFSAAINDEGGFGFEAYISANGSEPGQLVYTGEGEVFNYAYWSPENCVAAEHCRDLAILLSSQSAGGLFVELVRDTSDEQMATSNVIGIGGPFYYSWSPDGTRMLWQRNNRRLDIYEVASDEIIETLPQTPGFFQSPAWSPVDDRLLFGALNVEERATDLVIMANGVAETLVSGLDGPAAFAWSPNGNMIAYTDRQGPLFIVDALTGETIVRSNTTGVIAFFWSPNSDHLAYVTLAAPEGSFNASAGLLAAPALQGVPTGIAWSVLDIEDGETRRYGAFIPTQEMAYLLIYFDQFAQSHRVWSPDSRHLLYSELTREGDRIINLLDTSRADTVPISIAEGVVGIWSFG